MLVFLYLVKSPFAMITMSCPDELFCGNMLPKNRAGRSASRQAELAQE